MVACGAPCGVTLLEGFNQILGDVSWRRTMWCCCKMDTVVVSLCLRILINKSFCTYFHKRWQETFRNTGFLNTKKHLKVFLNVAHFLKPFRLSNFCSQRSSPLLLLRFAVSWLRSWTSRPALAKASALLPHRAGALIFRMPHSVSRHTYFHGNLRVPCQRHVSSRK